MFLEAIHSPLCFKINRGDAVVTAEVGRKIEAADPEGNRASPPDFSKYQWLLETLLITACFYLYAGQPAPDVNESHYLTKAKHFWDPAWCSGDLFLGSGFSHWLFYISTGWLTKFMSLTAYAWTGRIVTWVLMAFAWQRLSHAIVPLKFMSVLSALFFLLLNDRFHLAGEWVVGGFEAKGIAYFFVIYALSFLVRGQLKWVWPLLGAASAFHVLVGGWAVLASLFAVIVVQVRRSSIESTWQEFWSSRAKRWWLPLLIGGVIALPGILPPLLSDFGASAEERQFAANLYVHQRIAHHLDFGAFPIWHVARFALLCVFWYRLYVWLRNRLVLNPIVFHRKLEPLQDFAAGTLLISFCGLILSGLAETGSTFSLGLLRFYWFRLADFAIPATTALASCFLIAFWLERAKDGIRRFSSVLFTVCVLLAAILLFVERNQKQIPWADVRSLPQYPGEDLRFRQSWENWRTLCDWVRNNTPEDAVFITPYQQQTFKWYSGRTEVVSWKDIPQDARSMIEWDRRLKEIQIPQQASDLGMLVYDDDRLSAIAEQYGADYLVLPQSAYDLASLDPDIGRPEFKCVYPAAGEKATWVILKLR